MVDINNDGYLDIYVSVSGPEWSQAAEQRANLLFINNGNRTFTEAAAQYGIADTGFTTHAVFLDYNGDGCLDLFLLNNSPTDFSRGEVREHAGGHARRDARQLQPALPERLRSRERSPTSPARRASCATPALDSASPSPT